MSAVAQPTYTYEEYLQRERVAPYKSEFFRGQIFAMSGGTPRHNLICVNIVSSLRTKLRGSPCRPYNSDQRIRIPLSGLATYPDVSVICGQLEPDRQDADAAINPRVLFEVLSPATEKYVRGKKFDFYRGLDSLQEYVLVSQEEPQVERFTRQQNGGWLLTVFKGLEAELDLSAIACRLSLAEIYEDITFGPADAGPDSQPTMSLV